MLTGRSRIENETGVHLRVARGAELSSALPKDVQNLLPACRLCARRLGMPCTSCPCYSTLSHFVFGVPLILFVCCRILL